VDDESFSVNVLAPTNRSVGVRDGQWGKWSEDTNGGMEEASAVWIFRPAALCSWRRIGIWWQPEKGEMKNGKTSTFNIQRPTPNYA